MKNKFAVRNKTTGEFLSIPKYGRRRWGSIDEAALWNKRQHAQLAVNYRGGRDGASMEIMEFNVILIDAKKGYIG